MGEQREKLIHFLDQFVSLMQLILQRNKDDITFTQAFFFLFLGLLSLIESYLLFLTHVEGNCINPGAHMNDL